MFTAFRRMARRVRRPLGRLHAAIVRSGIRIGLRVPPGSHAGLRVGCHKRAYNGTIVRSTSNARLSRPRDPATMPQLIRLISSLSR